ncbi:hypothetical protein NCCP2331_22500 [Sporosarcina sp. NCCP-2331]|nr:hypothetical protein NCCP2331_22500 [Sporosarcina sp. NCCP-2331]GLB56145.1 hypothetical protein NCCP2378_19320 [Sporosarcina sp. NCCP-2378]
MELCDLLISDRLPLNRACQVIIAADIMLIQPLQMIIGSAWTAEFQLPASG